LGGAGSADDRFVLRRRHRPTPDNVDVLGALWHYLPGAVRDEILGEQARAAGGAQVKSIKEPPAIVRRVAAPARRLA
jgi:hypothetical protein